MDACELSATEKELCAYLKRIVHDEDSFLGIMFALIVDQKDTEENCRRLLDFLKDNPGAGYRDVINEVNEIMSDKEPSENNVR